MQVLRKRWGFSGFVASDCGAVEAIHLQHGYTKCARCQLSFEKKFEFRGMLGLPQLCGI